MTLSSPWLLRLAGHDRSRERTLAEASRASERSALDRVLAEDETRFARRMRALESVPHVTLGASATGVPYRIALPDLTSLPAWVTAATGAGKSRFVGAMLEPVLRHAVAGAPVSIVVVDGKGETADQFLRSVAVLAAALPGAPRRALLDRLHTLRFFDHEHLPSWPLLLPVAGLPIATQSDAVAEVLTDIVADATVGPRQRSMLSAIVALAMEHRMPAVELPWLLSSPKEVTSLAARSSIPSVRLDLSRFEREPQGSIDGLVARLGTVLRIPSLKAVLSGAAQFEFSACFEPGAVTTIDFGGADLGARAGVRAMGSLAITALANAAFDPRRAVRSTTMIVVDEPSVIMTGVTLGQFERLVTLGRSFGAGGLVCVHQGATQLPLELQTVLNTNVPLRVLGRSSERDASAASEWLPRTGRVPRPREPGVRAAAQSRFMSEGQEDRFRVAEIGRLPARHFLVADRRASFASRIIRAPEHDPPAWDAIDPEIADAVRRGTSGVPRAELERRVREIEDQAAARLASSLESAAAKTPEVVGRPRRGGWRGETP